MALKTKLAVCNAILKFPPQHELSQLLMSVCSAPNKLLPYDSAIYVKSRKWEERLSPR